MTADKKNENKKENILDYVTDTAKAAEMWGLSVSRVKQLAEEGSINAKKLGRFWVVDITQENPKKNNK